MNPSYTTFSNADLLNAAVGIFMPLVVSFVLQPRWKPWMKSLFTTAACIAVGAVTAYLRGDLTPANVLRSFLVVIVTSSSIYTAFWKPTGVASAIEKATSPKPKDDPQAGEDINQ